VITEGAPKQRIFALGDRLIAVLEQEDDGAVMLSALAFAVASACDAAAGRDPDLYSTVAECFVQTFRGIRPPAGTVH
jgi:hypothetical protein